MNNKWDYPNITFWAYFTIGLSITVLLLRNKFIEQLGKIGGKIGVKFASPIFWERIFNKSFSTYCDDVCIFFIIISLCYFLFWKGIDSMNNDINRTLKILMFCFCLFIVLIFLFEGKNANTVISIGVNAVLNTLIKREEPISKDIADILHNSIIFTNVFFVFSIILKESGNCLVRLFFCASLFLIYQLIVKILENEKQHEKSKT